jgi:hypothetical protein
VGRRGISTCIIDRKSIATRASGKARAEFTYAPAMLAYEKCVTPALARIGRRRYRTRAETRPDVFDHIARFHNPRRARIIEPRRKE